MLRLCVVLAVWMVASSVAPMSSSAAFQMHVDGPSGRLFADDGGRGGPAVVFIHSLAGNAQQWKPQLAHLRRTRRAVALDLRGHGRSDAPADGALALDAYAADVRKTMDALGIERAVLVGHSMGGGVAVAFADLWPERALGLVLVDPIDDPSKRPADGTVDAFIKQLDGADYERSITGYWTTILQSSASGVRAQVLADLKATPKSTVIGSMRAMIAFNAEAALARYRGPVWTITTPLNEYPSSLQNVVPRIKQEKMTGVSHWLQLDRPDDFNALLDRLLAQIRH